MNEELKQSIGLMVVNGNRLELPTTPINNYPQVKRTLTKAGGKYKKNGFDFTSDASAIKLRLVGGEEINDKKKFQFFATPPPLAEQLVEMAEIGSSMDVLEPSAGQGAIVDEIIRVCNGVVLVEIMDENILVLKREGWEVHEGDFLQMTSSELGTFDRIVANPPFTKHQDIDHIRHMYELLNEGGRVVTIASETAINSSHKKAIQFREWLQSVGCDIHDVPKGSFKESGTMVGGVILVIDK